MKEQIGYSTATYCPCIKKLNLDTNQRNIDQQLLIGSMKRKYTVQFDLFPGLWDIHIGGDS